MLSRRQILLSIAGLPLIHLGQEPSRAPARPRHPKAPPLPPPAGEVIRVTDTPSLLSAALKVKPGGTILLADGLYQTSQPVHLRTDGVTLRSESGRRDHVTLDGGFIGELITVSACSDVTIADLTLQNVKWNAIKLNTDSNVQRARIYNCTVRNVWQRFVKGVLVPEKDREKIRPRGCRIEYCLFYNDRPKRFEDDTADTAENFGGNYIGGIDVMYASDWVIRDNVFAGIRGRTGEGRGAVFLWHDSQGCIVERNVILDCDSGICLGNSFKREDFDAHCTECTVRNNFLTRVPENGILADFTKQCRILHNTVCDPTSRKGRLIRVVHVNDGLMVINNLLCGAPIRPETKTSLMMIVANVEKNISSALVAPEEGNLRLTPRAEEAIMKAGRLQDAPDDIDGRKRSDRTDAGAHELRR